MRYLIMKCDVLNDQWECDADRTPICMTDDWEAYFNTNDIDYQFEVWELKKDNSFECVKEYDEAVESGMVFGYVDLVDLDQKNNIILRFPNLTRRDVVPAGILERAKAGKCFDDTLSSCGTITWEEDNNMYFYAEYEDNRIYVF